MKKLFLGFAACIATSAAYGQGQFFLNTHDPTTGNVLTFVLNGAPATGTDVFVEVLAGTDSLHLNPLTPLLALNRTGAGAGLTSPFGQVYTVPGMTAGQTATVAVLGFQGTSPATATLTSGIQALGIVTLTEPPTPPNEVITGTKSILIPVMPEPSSWILIAVGAVGLLSLRNRSEYSPE